MYADGSFKEVAYYREDVEKGLKRPIIPGRGKGTLEYMIKFRKICSRLKWIFPLFLRDLGFGILNKKWRLIPDLLLENAFNNAAASDKSLGIMLTFAAIGTPMVIGYTTFVYLTFRGKVKIDEMSY